MRTFDVSVPISFTLPVWPGEPRVVLRQMMSLAAGNSANVSHLSLGVHTGTHVDAPSHFIHGGVTVDQLPLDVLIGPASVCHLNDVEEISRSNLDQLSLPPNTCRLLLSTRNSMLWAQGSTEFKPDFVALTPNAATWVVERGIRLIGVDYLSIQRFQDSEPTTHRTLLSAGVVIVEGLNLSNVPPGSYQLVCLPLKLEGCDGAPARVVLLEV